MESHFAKFNAHQITCYTYDHYVYIQHSYLGEVLKYSFCANSECLFADVEAEYQAFLAKKEETEKSYQDTQAELDGLMREVESVNNQLTVVLADETVANELVKTLPEEIKLLEVKIESASKLLFSES